MNTIPMIIFGVALLLLAWRLWVAHSLRWLNRFAAFGMLAFALPITGVNSYRTAMSYRPEPAEITSEVLFDGITYTRDVRSAPEPLVIHVVEIDLTHPDISLAVTPPDDSVEAPYETVARTTSGYLVESEAQLAINAGFFDADGFFSSSSPSVGDPVDVIGLTAYEGDVFSEHRRGFRVVYLSEDNRIQFDTPPEDGIYNALSGFYWFLRHGSAWVPHRGTNTLFYQRAPRTVIATDVTGERLLLFVVDGRQPGYSVGVTMLEMTEIAADYGAHNALNMDGGGSSALAVDDGDPRLLNSPVHRNLPGLERPVGNHLVVYAGD
ncbi:MAG: phosphodiester glycosidase family protein [Chloroflexota bacterium]